MDEFLDLVKKLELPEKGNTHLEELRNKVLDVWEDGDINLTDLIHELKDGIDNVSYTVQGNIDLPILYFLKAHCLYVETELSGNQNSDRARKDIEKAADKFRVFNSEWNESLAHCYHGLLHYRAGDLDPCHKKLTFAAQILMRLERNVAGTKYYEKLQKIKSQIDIVTEQIKRAEKRYTNPDGIEENAYQNEMAIHRLIIHKLRKRLSQHYSTLRGNQKRIPPTLVATLFYLYKNLAPSHSVYSEVPKPATDREKMLYEELLNKIGFFEVIEQLIAMEQEFNLAASREELLEIINREWDKDVKQ